jgi:hypothetical protein
VRRTLLNTLLLALVLAAPARAEDPVRVAAGALSPDQPVYVSSAAGGQLSPDDADRLTTRIRNGAGPMFVALLPASAGTPVAALRALQRDVGRPGTYVVVLGKAFRAGSNDLAPGVTDEQAQAAYSEHYQQGVSAVLFAFADRMAALRKARAAAPKHARGSAALLLLLLPLLAIGGGAVLVTRKRRRTRRREAIAGLRETAGEDLVALGDDIRALDLDVKLASAARDDYAQAVASYKRASSRYDLARDPEDFAAVATALEEGRYATTAARARLAGLEPPERTPPCFFDPRHGPSGRDVEWAPPGGSRRLVPACEADAQRVERGQDPEYREVERGGRRVPYWCADPAYAPFFGGFYGGLLAGDVFAGWGGDRAGDAVGDSGGGGDV